MKIKVVGIQDNITINFTDRASGETNTYHGKRIHYTYTLPSGSGVGCNQQFLNDTKFANVPVNLNGIYIADMAYGKIQYLEELDGKRDG